MREVVKAVKGVVLSQLYRQRYGAIGGYLGRARAIGGWTSPAEMLALAEAVMALPPSPVIVELGSWLGRSAVVLAGACRMRGDGHVHCVDRFDGGGDAHSLPTYARTMAALPEPLIAHFQRNVLAAGVSGFVTAHPGDACSVAAEWRLPIDLLFMDADQSEEGVQTAFQAWTGFLKPGAVLALHNSVDTGAFAPDHNGHFLLAQRVVKPPAFAQIRVVDSTTFAVVSGAVVSGQT